MDHLSEIVVQLVRSIAFTIACGGLGFILITSLFDNVASKRLSEYLMMTISLGLALIILVVIGMSALNIPLNKFNLSVIFLSLFGLWFFRFANTRTGFQFNFSMGRDLKETLLLGILFFCLFLIRAVQVREVIVPNWFDGLVHTSLVQKFVINETIPIDRIYHTGFHSIALAVYQFWGMTIPQTVLFLGQWFSVICGIMFYSFVRRVTHHIYVAYISVSAYSLLLFFPSHLVSWSRFPFLLGLTLLPPAILTSIDWINNNKGNYFLTLILITSLFISHYGSFLIWFSYVLVHLVYKIGVTQLNGRSPKIRGAGVCPPPLFSVPFRELRKLYKIKLGEFKPNVANGKSISIRLFLLFSPLLLFAFPKVINLWERQDIIEKMLLRVNDPDFGFAALNVMNLVLDNNSLFVLIWLLVSIWSFIKGKKIFSIIIIWPLTILFLTWIQYHFLGISITSFANFLIFFSIPFAFSFGLLFFRSVLYITRLYSNRFATRVNHLTKRNLNILLVIAIIPGMFTNFKIINPETIVFSEEDQLAMEWINDNTPPDSTFLIRSVLWGENTFMPSDGGGWISLLTGRQTVYPQAIGELYDICVFARENKAEYIYFGKQSGDIPFDLRLSDLDEQSYRMVYETQNIRIVYLLC